MQIDHVIVAVKDLDEAAHHFRDRFGLVALPGGTHPMGTANRAIPLANNQYIELLGVGQEELLRSHQFGERLLHVISQGSSLLSWAVCVDDIEAEAARLRRPLVPGQWEGAEGEIGRWHNIFPDFEDVDTLPFFIHYVGDNTDHRRESYDKADSPARPGGIAWLELGDNANQMKAWLNVDSLPLRFTADPPGLYGLAIESPDGEIVIRNEDL
jgi:catechol 2,3-dioxygenase-like lactoylglutathione lyase family enzyme